MSESALEEFDVSEVSYEIGLYNNSFIKHFVAVAAYIHSARQPIPGENFKTKEFATTSGFSAQPHLRHPRLPSACHFDSRPAG